MSLVVSHINKSFGDRQVLRDISFEVGRGEIIGLLGKNGVGKTTILKILAGISSEYDGSITIDGTTQRSGQPYRMKIGYMSEKNPLYPHHYVREYLGWIAGVYGIADAGAKVSEVISAVGLDEMSGRLIKELSKGYQQRVGLAAAILHDPDVLLLDEPVNGLDPAQIIQFREMLTRLSRDKVVILSSHLMQEIEATCGRILLLEDGRLAKDEILRQANITQKWVLQTAASLSETALQKIAGVTEVRQGEDHSYLIETQAGADPRQQIFNTVAVANTYILELKEYKQDLDELFKDS